MQQNLCSFLFKACSLIHRSFNFSACYIHRSFNDSLIHSLLPYRLLVTFSTKLVQILVDATS